MIALGFGAPPVVAGSASWAHQAPVLSSNGSVTVKSLSGGTYVATQNPTGTVAKASQNAATQPPTVIIQASGNAGCYIGMTQANVDEWCDVYGWVRKSATEPLKVGQYVGGSTKLAGSGNVYNTSTNTGGDWESAKAKCQALGPKWRLPTLDELTENLYYSRGKLNFYTWAVDSSSYYWSSTPYDSAHSWFIRAYEGSNTIVNGHTSFSPSYISNSTVLSFMCVASLL